jgi:hypothetical protein
MYRLLRSLGIVTKEQCDEIELAASHNMMLSMGPSMWEEKALVKRLVASVWVASGRHGGWQDGGHGFQILKLDGGSGYAAVGWY